MSSARYVMCKNCIGKYHSEAPESAKMRITSSLQDGDNGPLRLILASVSLGMGIDNPAVRQVIHIGCPSDLEAYTQEIGRAQGHAIMHVNGHDTSKRHVTKETKAFCLNSNEGR